MRTTIMTLCGVVMAIIGTLLVMVETDIAMSAAIYLVLIGVAVMMLADD